MKLRELLEPRAVLVPLKAKNVRDATRQLAKSLAAAGAVADEARLMEILKTEWPEDVVTAPGRAFLPHFRTDAARRLAVGLGVAAAPLCLADDPTRCARIVALVIAPVAQAAEYLRAMSALAQALTSDETLEGLHRAAGPNEVLAIAALAEAPVPADVTVRDVMTTSVTSVGPDVPLREAARVLLERGVRALPVTGPAGEVLGLVTDGHLMRHLLPQTVSALSTGQVRAVRRRGKSAEPAPAEPGEVAVRRVMDRFVLCLSEDQTVADVAALMLSKDVDRFPVTRDGALVGFVTRGDIVRKLLGK